MRALVFDYKIIKLAIGRIAGLFGLKHYLTRFGYLKCKEIPEPVLKSEDWVVIRTLYCGICGSDSKQVFLDGNQDNLMTAMISWPQILGHEVVGTIERVGPKVKTLKVGDRVVLNPWLSCLPRGLPPCEWCSAGKNTLCRNFKKGILAPGIHTGNSSDATGGFAEFVPAHESMAYKIPDGISWEQAVLADPFSVAFHSILKIKIEAGSTCAVYGCGNLGLLTVHILKRLFKDVKVIAIARFPHQGEMALKLGADKVIDSMPPYDIVKIIGASLKCEIYYPKPKLPWLIEGVDFVFDTVASRETLEIGLRIVKAKGTIVVTGVSTPKRFEWTPWYFKEIRMIGSNAFAVESFEGRKEHSYLHYFRLLEQKRVDPAPIITHKFPISQYKSALVATRKQGASKAIKVVLTYEPIQGGNA